MSYTNRTTNRTNATTNAMPYRSKRIQAALATQISIVIPDDANPGVEYTVGAVQELRYSQSRPLERYKEIGTDGVIQIAPNGAPTFDLTINRIVFDWQRLPQSLQREYRHIHAQRRPFDIYVYDYNTYLPTDKKTIEEGGGYDSTDGTTRPVNGFKTVFKNCWFNSLNVSYRAENYQIVEDASLWCEHVYDEEAPQTLSDFSDKVEKTAGTSSVASVMTGFDNIK
jgi:hypothetical protein